MPIFSAFSSLASLKSQTRDQHLKSLPEDFALWRIHLPCLNAPIFVLEASMSLNWLRLSRPAFLHGNLLSGLDGRALWLKSFLLDVSPPSVYNIFKSGLIWLPEMPQRDGGERPNRNYFSYRPRTGQRSI